MLQATNLERLIWKKEHDKLQKIINHFSLMRSIYIYKTETKGTVQRLINLLIEDNDYRYLSMYRRIHEEYSDRLAIIENKLSTTLQGENNG